MRINDMSCISGKMYKVHETDYGFEADPIYIKEVKYNNPATIVFWSDNTKTVTKCCGDDIYSSEAGLAICIMKKLLGVQETFDIFMDWLPEYESDTTGVSVKLKDVRKTHKEIEKFMDKLDSGELDVDDVTHAIQIS